MLQISEALQKNKFLTSLDLSSNRITDGGAEVSWHTLHAHAPTAYGICWATYATIIVFCLHPPSILRLSDSRGGLLLLIGHRQSQAHGIAAGEVLAASNDFSNACIALQPCIHCSCIGPIFRASLLLTADHNDFWFVFWQALVAVLSHGAAPELIYLDLRGNPLTEAGTTALVSHAEHLMMHTCVLMMHACDFMMHACILMMSTCILMLHACMRQVVCLI